jgi:hypothetical protein
MGGGVGWGDKKDGKERVTDGMQKEKRHNRSIYGSKRIVVNKTIDTSPPKEGK